MHSRLFSVKRIDLPILKMDQPISQANSERMPWRILVNWIALICPTKIADKQSCSTHTSMPQYDATDNFNKYLNFYRAGIYGREKERREICRRNWLAYVEIKLHWKYFWGILETIHEFLLEVTGVDKRSIWSDKQRQLVDNFLSNTKKQAQKSLTKKKCENSRKFWTFVPRSQLLIALRRRISKVSH